MPLLCVVTCCRSHDLRMTAAAVAYELPWQEGTWDTKVVLLGQLGSVLMEEREGMRADSSRPHPDGTGEEERSVQEANGWRPSICEMCLTSMGRA